MLYTPMPLEIVWADQAEDTPMLMSATVHGRPCLLRRTEDGTFRIARLLSTDPADFLDDRFEPDTALDWWF